MNQPLIRDGFRLNALIAEGDGEPVVFQHGLLGSAAQTAEAFPADPRFRLATLECRGHGASEAGDPARFTLSDFAEDVEAFMLAHVPTPAIIGGISMGAALALRIAVQRPHHVKALVLARPAWMAAAAPPNLAPNRDVATLLAAHPPHVARQMFLTSSTAEHLRQHAPDNLASLASFFGREPVQVTAQLLGRIAADGPGVTRGELGRLAVPTLIIATEQDAIHPMSLAEALNAAIPGSTLRMITPKGVDKARHLSEFRSTLLAFFETVNAKRP